ncbi:MAG: hypothetical protein K5907_03440 [Treponema sp.]|nr:hypothetical protein [Treponema sp.]
MQKNPQILSAKADYEASLLLSKNSVGYFAPGLSLSGSETTEDNYSASVTYSQPLPGGTDQSTRSFSTLPRRCLMKKPWALIFPQSEMSLLSTRQTAELPWCQFFPVPTE